jgi:hypothetical protein
MNAMANGGSLNMQPQLMQPHIQGSSLARGLPAPHTGAVMDVDDTRSASEYKAEIARLKNEVQRLNVLLGQKEELLIAADMRIRKLQEFVPKLRGGKQPMRNRQSLPDELGGAPGGLSQQRQQPPTLEQQAAGERPRMSAAPRPVSSPGLQPPPPPGSVGVVVGVVTGTGKEAEAGSKRKRQEGSNRPGWCHHNRQRSRCIECGGSGVCEHQRVKRNCKECGGYNLCIPHKKPKSRCIGTP